MIEPEAQDTSREDAAAIIGAELARMVVRRDGKTWVRLSVWSKPENLSVDLFELPCQAGWVFMLDEMRDGRDVVGYVRRSIERMVKKLEADIKERADYAREDGP